MSLRLTVVQRRLLRCPTCNARQAEPCRGSRIPGPNTFGGGWGGPAPLEREHKERIAAARVLFGGAAS